MLAHLQVRGDSLRRRHCLPPSSPRRLLWHLLWKPRLPPAGAPGQKAPGASAASSMGPQGSSACLRRVCELDRLVLTAHSQCNITQCLRPARPTLNPYTPSVQRVSPDPGSTSVLLTLQMGNPGPERRSALPKVTACAPSRHRKVGGATPPDLDSWPTEFVGIRKWFYATKLGCFHIT